MHDRKRWASAFTALALAVLLLTACGAETGSRPSPEADPVPAATGKPIPTENPSPTETSLPTVKPSPEATVAPEPTPTPAENETDPAEDPEASPSPEPSAVPDPKKTGTPAKDKTDPAEDPEPSPSPTPTLPRVTKSPTDETVEEGGSCLFLAGYENAEIAVWHFVSPDGQTDMTYEAAQTAFPTMDILNGMYSNLQLKNIPYAANGWKVYCRYSNTDAGYVDTAMARITVIPVLARQSTQPAPGSDYPVAQRSDFEGSWADTSDGRCQILFTYRDEGSLNVGILWRDLSGRRDCWNMTATVYSEGVLVYNDGHYWAEVYSNDNSYTVSAESWNGTGSFYFRDGQLHWYNGQTGAEVTLRPT